IIGRGVAELDNLTPTDWQNRPTGIGRGRAVQDDIAARRAISQAARGQDRVEYGFSAAELVGARSVDLANDVIYLALARHHAHREDSPVLDVYLGLDGRLNV